MQIYNADFLTMNLASLPRDIKLIVTSPPYNIGIDYGLCTDNLPYKDYLEFSKNWLNKCFDLLADDGVICINVPLDTGNDGVKRSLSADLTILAKRAGFKYKGTIIWNKQAVKNKFSTVFSKNIEVILIFTKGAKLVVKSRYKDWVNNIWTFVGENPKRVNHPAAFPPELARRLVHMFSAPGEVIFDPFMGSGTTVVVAEMYGRQGIGVELNQKYFSSAKIRIEGRKL